MKVAVVVPWRGGDKHRERNWRFVREWWAQLGWPVFEVEHPPPDAFNRSWTINEGARRAWPWDILIAADGDVIEGDPQQIREGVELAHETQKLVIPHTEGHDLSDLGAQHLIDGRDDWQRHVAKRRPICTSRIQIYPLSVFERVGGFDERFEGWGHEDVAFWACARTVNGAVQLPGIAYHLHHQPSLPKARATQEWRQGKDLCERYLIADKNGLAALDLLLAERRPDQRWERPVDDTAPPPQVKMADQRVDVFCLTAGRKEYLERTLASFAERVHGDIQERVIQDDSGDPAFGRWLAETYPDWEIITTKGKIGFTKAIRNIWRTLRNRDGAPYMFHLEEDFVFERDVELADMIDVLNSDPRLAQAALLRGPFFEPEFKAGGIVEEDPAAYEHRDGYLAHTKYFTTNPCLYRRRLMTDTMWPNVANSETLFTRNLVRQGKLFALMGDGTPWVSHIGHERTNLGY
jgi:hypothetical protein